MGANPRVIAATIAVAVATFLFSLVAPPLLSLAPSGAAFAQEGPKIEVELDPVGMVVQGTEIEFTLTFSNVTATGTSYQVKVLRGGNHDVTDCPGEGAFSQMTEITPDNGSATTTGTISTSCPAGRSFLIASLYDSDDNEITSTAMGFLISGIQSWNLNNASTTPYGVDLPTLGSPAGMWAAGANYNGGGNGVTRFYIVDSTNRKIHVYDLEGNTFTFSPDNDDGITSLAYKESYDIASTTNPWGIVLEKGKLWVADGHDRKIHEYSKQSGEYVLSREYGLNASSTSPRGMHFTGEIYVADDDANKLFGYEVQKNSRTPEIYSLTNGNDSPTGIWASGHVMWVADSEDNKLYAYDMYPNRRHMPEWDVSGITDSPAGIWSDYWHMYVLDSSNNTIYAYRLPNKYNARLSVSGPTYVKYAENRTGKVASYSVSSPQHLNWSLVPSGDHQHFYITSNGHLHFRTPPNFEDPKDNGGDNIYEMVIEVSIPQVGAYQPIKVTHYPVRVEVTDVKGEQPHFSDTSTTREIAENTSPGVNVGDPLDVDVEPRDEDPLTYSIDGSDAESFDFSTSTGQIITKAALDFEHKPSYSVRVSVRDDEDKAENPSTSIDDWINVTIDVTDVYEGPRVDGPGYVDHPETTRQVAEYTAHDPNNRPITWRLSGVDSGQFLLSATGTLSFSSVPDHETPGDRDGDNYYELTITATGGTESGSLDVTVYVSNVNEAPTFSKSRDTRSVVENTPSNQNVGDPVTASDVDEYDSSLTYELGGDDASSFRIDSPTGQILTSDPLDHETKSSYSVEVIVSDSYNSTSSINVAITVTDTNDQPEFADTSTTRSVVEHTNNAPVGAPVAATDQDGDNLHYELTGGATSTFSIDQRIGQLTTVGALDSETQDTYSVTVSVRDNRDDEGQPDTAEDDSITVTITVTDGNDKPAFPGATTSIDVPENTPAGQDIGAPVEAIDPDDDIDLTYSLTGTDASHFDIVTSTGQIKAKGTLNYEGSRKSYSVTVRVTDGRNVQGAVDQTIDDTIEVTINVTDVDEDGSLTLSPAQPPAASLVTATLSDPDGDISNLTWTWETSTSTDWSDVRTATSSDGTSDSYTPADADIGKSLRVTVSYTDRFGSGKIATTTATIAHGNQPPTLSGHQTLEYAENKTGAVATYTFSDPEGEDVTLEPTGIDGSHFRFSGGQLHFNAQPDFENPLDSGNDNTYELTIVADDKTRTTSLPVTVTVTDVNEPPQFPGSDTGIRSVTENTAAGQNVGAVVAATDPEDDELTYTLSGTDASHFDIATSTGQILAKSELNYEGTKSYSVGVSVTDNKNTDGSSNSAIDDTINITISVSNEDEAPTVTGATSTSFAENGTRPVATYIGRDPEGASVSWTIHGTDSAYFAISNSGALSFDPAPDFEDAKDSDNNNVYHVTVQASDDNKIDDLDVTVTVTNVEEAGTVSLSSVQPQVGTPLTATLHDPDEVVSAVTWTWQSSTRNNGGWSTISGATSTDYTPQTGDVSRYLRATASYDDGFSTGKSASAVSSNTVRTKPVNNTPPNFGSNSESRSVQENSAPGTDVGGPITASDTDDTLTYRLNGSDGSMFSIVPSSGQIQTRMPLDYESNTRYSVTVKAVDPSNASSTIPVTISVTNVDEPPVAVDDSATAAEDGSAVSVDVLANDSDPEGQSLTLASVTQPSNGSAVVENGQAKYTPNAGYYGPDQFTYTVSDGSLTSVGNVLVSVAPTADSTVQLAEIPIQFVPIDGGGERILLSDYFSDPDSGYPPYQATSSEAAIMTVEISEGYLSITPVGIGVATTTLTVSDTPGIRQQFRVVVYRPVVERTETETVFIVDPDTETTLVSKNGVLSVQFQAGSRNQFFQVAIDAQSNNCGVEAPVGHQHVCVLVDLFDLGAESIDENLSLPSTLEVTLDQTQYSAILAAVGSGEFSMWKGHGPEDITWELMQECPDPRGTDECYELTADQNGNGGKITVYNIPGFSEFAAGSDQPAPPPTEPPTTTPPPTTGGGGSGGSSGGGSGGSGSSGSGSGSSNRKNIDVEYQGNQTPQIFGRTNVTYSENGTEPVAQFEAEDADDDEITWSLLGYDRSKFEISQEGVLSFRSPPDYEDPQGRDGNTYRLILQAEDDGRPSEYDVHNLRVTVTQVNELGELSGDAELTLPENSIEAIAQYQVDDPEEGAITWSLSGPDASAFTIDEQGNLSPLAALDFENPGSADDSNVHTLKITATDDGNPELSADMDVSVTITNINEAPLVGDIPGVDLGSDDQAWLIDLGMYFTDPDGDDLGYHFSGQNITDVALAHLADGTLSIDPVSGGEVSFYVVATDAGGLSAVTSVAVSVTEPEPVPTPVPAVTVPVPVSTPAPAVVVPAPTPTVPEPAIVAPEPEPTFAPLPPLVELRIHNQTQEPDSVSKVIVAFALEPVDEPIEEVALPPAPTPEAPQKVSPIDEEVDGHSPVPLSATLDSSGGIFTIWLIILLAFVALVTGGYAVRMYVIHRL